jgi:hypothetical protein
MDREPNQNRQGERKEFAPKVSENQITKDHVPSTRV